MNAMAILMAVVITGTAFAVPMAGYVRRLPVHILDASLNNLNFEDLFLLEENKPGGCSAYHLKKYITYFERVAALVPNNADAYGMLGFCYFHTGQYDRAAAALHKAIDRNPYFWGFYYNLGVIEAARGNLAGAVSLFQKALGCPPAAAALTFSSSKIFADVVRQSKHAHISLQERTAQGYARTLAALRANAYALQTGERSAAVPPMSLF